MFHMYLTPSLTISLTHYLPHVQEQMLQSVADIGDSVKPLSNAAEGEAEKLGHEVSVCLTFSKFSVNSPVSLQ